MLQNQRTEAGSAAARARDQAEAWREAHKVQAWLHDRGVGHAPALRELEEQHEARHAEVQQLAVLHAAAEARAKVQGAGPPAHPVRAGADAGQAGRA